MAILNGWKEVASYLGRGVRTVQRWEELGLPVRRPKGSDRSAVVALSEELDAWIRGCRTHEDHLRPRVVVNNGEWTILASRTDRLLEELRNSRQVLRGAIGELRNNLQTLRAQCAAQRNGQPIPPPQRVNMAAFSQKSAT